MKRQIKVMYRGARTISVQIANDNSMVVRQGDVFQMDERLLPLLYRTISLRDIKVVGIAPHDDVVPYHAQKKESVVAKVAKQVPGGGRKKGPVVDENKEEKEEAESNLKTDPQSSTLNDSGEKPVDPEQNAEQTTSRGKRRANRRKK